jgi:hypothetical protein
MVRIRAWVRVRVRVRIRIRVRVRVRFRGDVSMKDGRKDRQKTTKP